MTQKTGIIEPFHFNTIDLMRDHMIKGNEMFMDFSATYDFFYFDEKPCVDVLIAEGFLKIENGKVSIKN